MTKDASSEPNAGLALLREPFPAHQISKLPKPTKRETDEVRADYRKGIRCTECGAWHHPKVLHLDYVGHAALTDRLLDCDPEWNWEPAAINEDGTPRFDSIGGLWIRLTICGVTRLGYGHADGKTGGNAIKEVIGDALRNAAMRFGAALDLWHKGDLHGLDEDGEEQTQEQPQPVTLDEGAFKATIDGAQSLSGLKLAWDKVFIAYHKAGQDIPATLTNAKEDRKAALSKPDPQAPPADDDMTPDGAPIEPGKADADLNDEIKY